MSRNSPRKNTVMYGPIRPRADRYLGENHRSARGLIGPYI